MSRNRVAEGAHFSPQFVSRRGQEAGTGLSMWDFPTWYWDRSSSNYATQQPMNTGLSCQRSWAPSRPDDKGPFLLRPAWLTMLAAAVLMSWARGMKAWIYHGVVLWLRHFFGLPTTQNLFWYLLSQKGPTFVALPGLVDTCNATQPLELRYID